MDTGTKDAKHKKPEEQVKMLKELGYDGIGYTGCKGLAEMLEELDKNGLRLFTVYLDVSIDAGRKQYDPKLEEAIKILKGRNTILWLCMKSRKHKPSSPEGDENAVEIIREIADMADKAGLRVALYPHYGYWLERVEDAVRLIEKVNRKNVGATFNLCHYLMADNEKNMESLIKSAAPYLFVVTINGADAESKDWEGLIQTLDKGNFDLKQFLDILDEAGYSGPIGLQGYGIEGDADENLRRSINAWRKVTEVQSVQ
jgi:sugar phosphate isomerase/epimerase